MTSFRCLRLATFLLLWALCGCRGLASFPLAALAERDTQGSAESTGNDLAQNPSLDSRPDGAGAADSAPDSPQDLRSEGATLDVTGERRLVPDGPNAGREAGALDAARDMAPEDSTGHDLLADAGAQPEALALDQGSDAAQDDASVSNQRYADPFDNANAWFSPTGQWQAQGGVFRQRDCAIDVDALATLQRRVYADVHLAVDVIVQALCTDWKQVFLLARIYSLPTTGCAYTALVCAFDLDGTLYAASMPNVCTSYTFKSLRLPATEPLVLGTPYRLEATVTGSTIRCDLAGGPLSKTYSVSYTAAGFDAPGGVGVGTAGALVDLDNFVAEPL